MIVDCFDYEHKDDEQALKTSMKLLAIEGTYPLEDSLRDQPFPILKLNKVISKMLFTDRVKGKFIKRLGDYIIYDDFIYYVWKMMMKNLITTKKDQLTSNFIQNFLELLDLLIPTSQACKSHQETLEKQFMCKSVKFDLQVLRRNVNKVWNVIVQWNHDDFSHRQLLVLLLEKVMPYLDKPTMLTDYLMDSLDVGGQVSLLALQGIFVLIHKHNMSYPNIYDRLYMMFEPEIFHMKYKPRLFHLADIFLTSSYLPETLVAAFIKRLARLALIAPPQDIIVILHFIGNLIIRHPGLKKLICEPSVGADSREVTDDPFIMDESDPNKSQAIQSSLWELQLLRNHVLPSVATVAKSIMTQPLPGKEWDLAPYLNATEDDVSLDGTMVCFHSVTFSFVLAI